MSLLTLSLALLAALVAGLLLWRVLAPAQAGGRRSTPPAARAPRPVAPPAAAGRPASDIGTQPSTGSPRRLTAASLAPTPATPVALPPEALGHFGWLAADSLPDARRQALVAAVRRIPRPPAALHQLLSPQFLDRAGSHALSELISGQAQIAAKVLATVNSPFYGLQRPVSGIGQAVTFLGLNTVRGICLQYLLDDSFKPANPALKQAYGEIWQASTLASELCARLSAKLDLPDAGALVAQVLLSFIGHLATALLLSQQAHLPAGTALAGGALLDRCRRAQDLLGLTPAEIGALLLQEWGLPDTIVDEVRAIDRLLVTPVGSLPPASSQRLALAHLCARLGEHLAAGGQATAGGLAGLAAGQAMADDGFHLRGHLDAPALARLPEHLQAADLATALQALQHQRQARR